MGELLVFYLLRGVMIACMFSGCTPICVASLSLCNEVLSCYSNIFVSLFFFFFFVIFVVNTQDFLYEPIRGLNHSPFGFASGVFKVSLLSKYMIYVELLYTPYY